MSFDLTTTPTLQAVANGDQRQLAEDLQQRVEAAVAQADGEPDVIAAAAAQVAAEQRVAQLSRAERALNQFAKELNEKLLSAREAAVDAMIDSAANGKPDVKALNEIAALEHRGKHASRAIEKLVETLLPLAQTARIREESHATMTKARALERIAQQRAEKVLGQMRDAVSEEMVLPVDLSKGVAGALLAYAAEFKDRAMTLSKNADRLEATQK